MKDIVHELRIKHRFILEIRHEPIVEIFDKKGEIIKEIHPKLVKELKHWRVEGNTIVFHDANSVNDAVVQLKRMGIGLEDSGNLISFRSYLDNFIFPLYTKFQKQMKQINRIGFRIISVLRKDEETFEQIRNNVIGKTCKLPISKLNAIDYKIHVILEKGFYVFGPVKPDEPWLRDSFRIPDIKDPGYGIDVDSYVQDIEINSKVDLERAISALIDISKGIEEQLAITVGLLDVAK